MGIIRTQAIKSTVFIYFGVFLGFLNAAVLMPFILTTEEIGIISLLAAYTNVFSNLFAFGLPLITIKLFPRFRELNEPTHNGFFSFAALTTVIGVISGVIAFLLIKEVLISGKNSAGQFAPFIYTFMALFTLRLVFKNFDPLIRMLYNTVLGSFTENFLLKFLISITLIFFWLLKDYDFTILFILYAIALSSPGIVSVFYLIKAGQINFQFRKFKKHAAKMKKEILSLGLYGLLGSAGGIIVLVDKMMVGNLLGISETGIYTTAFFFGLFVSIPSKGIKRASAVVVSDAWHNNDVTTIKSVYYKSCLNQFLFAVYLFLGVWMNIDYIFEILPNEYALGKYVVLYIGLAQVFDMVTGTNNEIISSSPHYKLNTYFTASLIILVIGLNYLFIPLYGITGAGLASCLAIMIINLGRFIFLNRILKYQPLDFKIIMILICGIFCYLIGTLVLPDFANPYLNILVQGTVLTLIYWTILLALKVSEDVDSICTQILNTIRSKN
jgi:O-antigen/teichoic acid export membrane protein